MPMPLHRFRTLAFAALLLAAACTDRGPTELAPPEGQEIEARISCTVSVQDQQLRCGDPVQTKGPADIILGGQGTYVRLQSSNVTYAADVFSVDVTVQNLLPQPMGTPDGVTATGMKVFFDQGPTATSGTGEVTVANADGTGQFTQADQPYFQYAEMLQPRGMSAPRTWRFNVPATVGRFSFTVYVHTRLPAETGVLRWRSEAGAVFQGRSQTLYTVWALSPHDVFVGGRNSIFHWDGNELSAMQVEVNSNSPVFGDIGGTSRDRLFAGGSSGILYHYDDDGIWRRTSGSGSEYSGSIDGLWASGDTVIAVGSGVGLEDDNIYGKVVRTTDAGQTVSVSTFPGPTGTRTLTDVSATSTANVWVVGYDNVPTATGRVQALVMHSTDGATTWREWVHANDQNRYYSAVLAEPGRVFVGGGHIDLVARTWDAVILESSDGGETWTETQLGLDQYIREIWRAPDGTLHATGDSGGTYIQVDGEWVRLPPLTRMSITGVHGAGGVVYAVGGGNGVMLRYEDGAWSEIPLRSTATGTLRSVWGSGPRDVYAVGHRPGPNGAEQSLLMHDDGTGWSELGVPGDSTEFVDVWGTSASNVYVVGRRLRPGGSTGMIWRFDGSAWTATATPFAGTERQLTAVWGSGPGDVWVLGRQSGPAGDELVMLRSTDGGASWTESTLSNGSGKGYVLDAWGSGPENVMAVGYLLDTSNQSRSMVMRFDGTAWSATSQLDHVRLMGVWGADAQHVFVTGQVTNVGARGVIRRTADGGASWTEDQFQGVGGLHQAVYGVWGASATDVYAVGMPAVLHFNGTSWSPQGSQGVPILRAVWGSSARNVVAVGERGAILRGTR